MENRNIKLLKQYPYIYGWDGGTVPQKQADDSDFRDYEETEKVSLFSDILDGAFLEEIEKNTKLFDNLPNKRIPIYLYFSTNEIFHLFLEKNDIAPLLENERTVFLIGEGILESYFEDMQSLLPKEVFGCHHRKVQGELDEARRKRENRLCAIIKEVNDYYENNGSVVREHILSGKPKILLIKHRFSYAIKNHTRDCNDALRRLGYDTFVAEQKSDISRSYWIVDINKYRPDIILDIDEFRYSYKEQAPEAIVYVTWIQDYEPDIIDGSMAGRLGKTDYLMNHYVNDQRILGMGYPKERMIDAPVCANGEMYKPYDLTEQEQAAYQTDICIVSQGADVDGFVEESIRDMELEEPAANGIRKFLAAYGENFKRKETVCREKKDFLNEMTAYVEKVCQSSNAGGVLKRFTEKLHIGYHERLYRQALADWIIEAGYTNIRLWGEEWTHIKKYRPYAMGQAQNGETLSKILQSSRIVLGNNFFATGVARAWESILSGAFYMSNDVPEENDVVDIRKIMVEGDNLVIFHNRSDLLNKIEFYLNHENARRQMIEKGRKRALETMTFDALMEKTMNFIRKSQEEYAHGELQN